MSSDLYAPAAYPQDKSVCILVGDYQLYTKHGGDTFLQNVDNSLQEYTSSQRRRPQSTTLQSSWTHHLVWGLWMYQALLR
jgi:hypothetical protein